LIDFMLEALTAMGTTPEDAKIIADVIITLTSRESVCMGLPI